MSRRAVDRRTVLRGAGVALALPWLESLAPRAARGQAAAPPRPFIAMSFPCGVGSFWKPATTGVGDAWALSPILAPLAPVKSFVNVLQNVGNYGPFGGRVFPASGLLTAALLTCAKATINVSPPICGVSVDQVVAQALGGRTRLGSLQVGLSTLDSYTDGSPPVLSRGISWSSPTTPTGKLVDPQAVFDRIVTAGGAAAAPSGSPLAAARRAKNQSILDYVGGHATTVQARLSQTDRLLMDQFLTSVRALETSLEANPALPSCAVGTRPAESINVGMVPPDYDRDAHANLMIDLVVMALACDVTRVVSFMLDDARSDFVYNFLPMRHFTATTSTPGTGTAPGLHGATQAGNDNDGWATIDFWFVDKLSRLCQKLQASSVGGASLLDDTTIFFGSEMHGAGEDALDLPVVTVGRGGGALKTNQCIDFAATARKTERLANLHLTFLRGVFGLPNQTFGTGAPTVDPATTTTPANAFGNGTTVIPELLA